MGLSVCPRVNLVKNIGFGIDGTHTISGNNLISQRTENLIIKKYPNQYIWNDKADYYVFERIFEVNFIDKVKYFLKNKLWQK